MSAPLMEHAVLLRSRGLASTTIRKMAVGSAIGTVVSVPLVFLLAAAVAPLAEPIKDRAPLILALGACLLAVLGRNRLLALVSIIPMAFLFRGLPAVYEAQGIIEPGDSVNISFFLGITVGPLLVTLLELLNKRRRQKLPHGTLTDHFLG